MLMLALTCHAQMENVVEVENDFRPTVQDANKINTLPEVEETVVTHYNVDYTTHSFPTTNYAFQPIWAARNTQLLKPEPKGFATAAYGMTNNILGRVAYEFDLSPADRLAFDVSTRGYKNEVDLVTAADGKWESRFFTNRFAAAYRHHLNSQSAVYVNAAYATDVFNYKPLVLAPPVTDKQHNDLLDLEAGLTTYSFGRFGIAAHAALHTFNQKYATTFADGNSETIVEGCVTPEYRFGDNLKADVALHVHHASYGMDALQGNGKAVEGSTVFDATPHLYWTTDRMSLKAGVYVSADLDIAPDVDFTLHLSPSLDVYAEAHGGLVANSFRHFAAIHPYWQLRDTDLKLKNQFDQLRARGGVRLRPVPYLTLDLSAGYDLSDNRVELAEYEVSSVTSPLLYMPVVFADGRHFYANADVQLNYKDVVKADLSTQYNQWSTDLEVGGMSSDIVWRPQFEADWQLLFQPVKNLRVGSDLLFQSFKKVNGRYERKSTIDLGATISYTLPYRITVYAKGDNLLGRKYDQYLMYHTQDLNFMAGVAVTF